VLLTRAPLYSSRRTFALDLHVLGTPPAFVLSQDQTLQLYLKMLTEVSDLKLSKFYIDLFADLSSAGLATSQPKGFKQLGPHVIMIDYYSVFKDRVPGEHLSALRVTRLIERLTKLVNKNKSSILTFLAQSIRRVRPTEALDEPA
jgi:hypothetical protein